MKNIQQLGDLYLAIHINKLLFEQGKITNEMYKDANRIFTERILNLEKDSTHVLCDTA